MSILDTAEIIDRWSDFDAAWDRLEKNRITTADELKLFKWFKSNRVRPKLGSDACEFWVGNEAALLMTAKHLLRKRSK